MLCFMRIYGKAHIENDLLNLSKSNSEYSLKEKQF
jgi:hypothetical protein